MILHYLKVAVRNLMKYKVHSLISALCLAVGIVCYTLVAYWINAYNSMINMHDEEIVTLKLKEGERWHLFTADDMERVEDFHIDGVSDMSVKSPLRQAEIDVIDKNQKEKPFIVSYTGLNENTFQFYELDLLYGNRILEKKDEVVISRSFAEKAFGEDNPVGAVVHLSESVYDFDKEIRDYRIVNVVEDSWAFPGVDCYFSYKVFAHGILEVYALLDEGTTLSTLNDNLQNLKFVNDGKEYAVSALSFSDDFQKKQMKIVFSIVLFVASLILLSGMINFLKYAIQMFYNRQREVALRKSMGADARGLFLLLFSEVFCMLTVSFLLSLVITEIVVDTCHTYISSNDLPHIDLPEVYWIQTKCFVSLLVICLPVVYVPVWRLRRSCIGNYVCINNNKHVFRSVMMWLQLTIAIFFVGNVLCINMAFNEIFYSGYRPVSDDEEARIIEFKPSTYRLRQNISHVVDEFRKMPEIVGEMTLWGDLDTRFRKSYRKLDGTDSFIETIMGNANYFQLFNIPYQGEITDSEDAVYVSDRFMRQLEKDSIFGTVIIEGTSYRIAGTYKALYGENEDDPRIIGSAFFPVKPFGTFYFKIAEGKDTDEVIGKMKDICREYVPETLPLDIKPITDRKQTLLGTVGLIGTLVNALAFVSLLLVALSIYSAISLDTAGRQKEVAIRKINGASSRTIACMFGRSYMLIYILSFAAAFPFVYYFASVFFVDSAFPVDMDCGMALVLFVSMLIVVLVTVAYKIYKVMHINPAEIIKTE